MPLSLLAENIQGQTCQLRPARVSKSQSIVISASETSFNARFAQSWPSRADCAEMSCSNKKTRREHADVISLKMRFFIHELLMAEFEKF